MKQKQPWNHPFHCVYKLFTIEWSSGWHAVVWNNRIFDYFSGISDHAEKTDKDCGQEQEQQDIDMPGHVPGEVLVMPMEEPSQQHKNHQDVPSIEPLNARYGAAQVRVRYHSHEDDQPAKSSVPVPKGIDCKEGYDKREDRIPDQFISPVFVHARIGR